MRCPSCARDIPDSSLFCSSCGRAVPAREPETIAETSAGPGPAGSPTSGGARRSGATSQKLGRFTPGTEFAGRYRIVALLGKGGMGEVYRADDLTLDQPVALKFLPDKVAADPLRLEQFYSEVRVARQVSHPNVCRIYDIAQADGQHFLSMEYVDGEDLASLLRRIGRLPKDKALEIARQLCAGLAAAHQKGVLHRDLKPANVMIDGQGKVRLADFGLARSAEDYKDPKSIEGTPAYMAPEQFSGRGASVGSDLYALGLVLYEMFTGRAAFQASTTADLVRMHRDSHPTNPTEIAADVDPIVERVILRCLEKDPAARPASALAVSAALPGGDPLAAALAAGETPSPEMVAAAGDQGALSPAVAWAGLAWVLAALGLILLLSGSTSMLNWIPQPKSPEALAERSRELIKSLGYLQDPSDTAYGYEETDFVARVKKERNQREQFKAGQPPSLAFWFRQSPEPLINQVFYHAGMVQPSDPPLDKPGMVRIKLDTEGRLVDLYAVPAPPDLSADGQAAPEWNRLFRAAGLELEKFQSVQAADIPPTYADTRAAWEGNYPQRGDIGIHVEAAAAGGKPVFFRIYQPWNRPARRETPATGTGQKVVGILLLLLSTVAIFAGALILAWLNLKRNRCDRRGALRLSLYLFLLETAARMLRTHYVADIGETIGMFWLIISRALFYGALVWLAYTALEPHIRRLWPHTIISWSRLLAGQYRDPRIGRDILAGASFGLTVLLLDQAAYLLAPTLGFANSPSLAEASAINSALGVRSYLGILSTSVTSAVSTCMYLFLAFFLMRLILRKELVAGAVLIAVIAAGNAINAAAPYVGLFLGFVFGLGIVVILRRFGLVGLLASLIFTAVPQSFPVTANFSLWFSNVSTFTLMILAALAIYAFVIALAGKPALSFDLLKE